MKAYYIILMLLVFVGSCSESRTVRHSGFDDLVVGVYEIKLFENSEFTLELGLGAKQGTYEMSGDTVKLEYIENKENWPTRLLMTKTYFKDLDSDGVVGEKTITRNI